MEPYVTNSTTLLLLPPACSCAHLQGLRGCRLGTVHPEITEMQVRAIIEAAVNVAKEGIRVHPHIMIPLVGIEDELVGQAKIVNEVAAQVFAATGGCRGFRVAVLCYWCAWWSCRDSGSVTAAV